MVIGFKERFKMKKSKKQQSNPATPKAPTFTFVSLEPGFNRVERASFKEAFTDMFKWVDNLLKSGGMSYQVLETAIWIERSGRDPLFFYDARDLAYEIGVMVDGKLIE